MRHRKAGRKLGRTSSHRQALFSNLLTALIIHESITTTLAKAKELRRISEKMITFAKRGDLHARRLALRSVKNKAAVKRLFDMLGQRYTERNGGYTRIYKLGPRHGDCAPMAVIEWIDLPVVQKEVEKK